jgi:hypothetical protein
MDSAACGMQFGSTAGRIPRLRDRRRDAKSKSDEIQI